MALLSSISFSLSQILIRKHIDKSNSLYISLTLTIMGNIILWPLALTYTNLNTVNPTGLLLFIAAGLLAPGIARLFYLKGVENVGTSANASIFATYPIYTTVIATLLLGETLTTENWMGLACTIAGVIFVTRTLNNNTHKMTTKKALIVPVIGSLAIAASQIIRKDALNMYNEPLLGVAVGYTTSLIVYVIVALASKNSNIKKFSTEDLKLFWKPGVGIAAGWLLSFLALSQEMVSIVTTVLQTELLFIILFGYLFLRKLEKFSLKLAASAALIVIGVILITIN